VRKTGFDLNLSNKNTKNFTNEFFCNIFVTIREELLMLTFFALGIKVELLLSSSFSSKNLSIITIQHKNLIKRNSLEFLQSLFVITYSLLLEFIGRA